MPVSFVKAEDIPKVEERTSKKEKKKKQSSGTSRGYGRSSYSYGSSMKNYPGTNRIMDMNKD